jgi:hypothetical protein
VLSVPFLAAILSLPLFTTCYVLAAKLACAISFGKRDAAVGS